MNPCPTRVQLQQLVAVQLRGPDAEAVEAHVEACAACQQQLEELTNTIDFQGCHPSDSPDPRQESPPNRVRPAVPGENSGEDFLRQLAKDVPADTWAFQEPGGRGAACTPRSADPIAAANSEQPVVAGYDILGKLGRGGMGVVYQARQRDAHRVVALKMILAGTQARPEEVARFRTEIEAVARLQHPHIVQIFAVGEWRAGDVSPPMPYFSMEFADGGSLAQQLVGIPWPCRRAAQLLEVLARAVHYAHAHGVLHRDLTPGNVLLMADGTPKLTDFGLAKIFIEGGATLTQSGVILGTPSYMPPEQAAGRSKAIGPAGDVYALGAILYEMLTGRPPFRAESPLETLRQVIAEEPVPPSRLQPHLPRDLVTICLKCLHKEPLKRYASALALADDLQRFLADQPIAARRTGTAERAWRLCRRKPMVAALTAVVVVLLVALAVGSTLSALWLREEQNDATEKLWGSYLDQARAGRFSRRMGQRFDSLKALTEAAKIARAMHMPPGRFLDMRNEAIACLALPDLRPARQWAGWPEGSLGADFDDRMERYVRTTNQGAVSVRRVADDSEIGQLHGSGGEVWASLSRDGQFLAVTSNTETSVWKVTGQGLVRVFQEPGFATGWDFSPDSRQFVIGSADGSIRLYDLASGQPPRQLEPGSRPVYLAFRPKHRQLAVGGATATDIRDLDSDKVLVNLPQGASEGALAWDPEGKTLAVVGNGHNIYLWDVGKRQQIGVLQGHKNGGIHVTFIHAGNLLASSDWDGILRLWDPQTCELLFTTPGGWISCRFRADDRLLPGWVEGTTLGLWEVTAGREYRTLVRDPALGRVSYYGLAINADSRLLAVGLEDGVGIWDLKRGTALTFLPLGQTQCNGLFEPSGALLTNGHVGVWRWPVQSDKDSPGLIRVGPPQPIVKPGSLCEIAHSQDGRVLAMAQFDGGIILDPERRNPLIPLTPHEDVRYIAVSPNGRLVATGSHTRMQVKIWEAGTGHLLKELPIAVGSRVGFSPDGRWLATSGGGCRLWEVGVWEERAPIGGGPFAFSPDSKTLAVETDKGVIRLVDPETAREYARLEDPHQDRAWHLGFSPDGTQLVTTNRESQSIHVWDLRAIRRQLADIGLDWDQPPYPAPEVSREAIPLKLTVDLGELATPLPKDKAR